jgi:hypothetical protein
MTRDADLRISLTTSRTAAKSLELLIVLLDHEFKLMDDFEFISEELSYPRDVLLGII